MVFALLSRLYLLRRAHHAQHLHHVVLQQLALGFLADQQQVQQVVVRQLHQRAQGLRLGVGQRPGIPVEESLDEQVVLEQAAAAAPAQLAQGPFVDQSLHGEACGSLNQTARRTISSLILPIALVGFSPFGQTSTQFMIVWQRNRRYGSSRLSSRPAVSWSRLSAMKR